MKIAQLTPPIYFPPPFLCCLYYVAPSLCCGFVGQSARNPNALIANAFCFTSNSIKRLHLYLTCLGFVVTVSIHAYHVQTHAHTHTHSISPSLSFTLPCLTDLVIQNFTVFRFFGNSKCLSRVETESKTSLLH